MGKTSATPQRIGAGLATKYVWMAPMDVCTNLASTFRRCEPPERPREGPLGHHAYRRGVPGRLIPTRRDRSLLVGTAD
jgi:hypothetical protein